MALDDLENDKFSRVIEEIKIPEDLNRSVYNALPKNQKIIIINKYRCKWSWTLLDSKLDDPY